MPKHALQLDTTGNFAVSFAIEQKSLKEEDTNEGKFGLFTGYASTFGNVDKHMDIVASGAFSATIRIRDKVKMLWQHSMDNLIGSFVELKEDAYGLLVTGRINLGTQQGKDAFALVKAGDLDTMSIGYRIKDYSVDRETGVRILKELDLMEISLVTIPANDMAQITAVKSFVATDLLPIATDEEKIEAILPLHYSDEQLNQAHLYKNDAKHQLCIGAIFNGEIKAIPRFIKECTKELKELDIPDQDKARIRQTLSKYYKEMGENSPWEAKSIDDLETITDVDDYLKDKGMSNKEVKKIISKIKQFTRQRDVVDDTAKHKERDAVDSGAIIDELKNLTKLIKGDRNV